MMNSPERIVLSAADRILLVARAGEMRVLSLQYIFFKSNRGVQGAEDVVENNAALYQSCGGTYYIEFQ